MTTETTNPESTALTVVEGEAEKPKTLRQYETIVEKNALRGAGYWRIAADALLAIKTHKLWKKAKDEDGNSYPSFVVYAEERFGFKKTYAYDLVKAASRKPEAITEGGARAEMRAERTPRPLEAWEAAAKVRSAFDRFTDAGGNLRDRAIADEAFTASYDKLVGQMFDAVAKWAAKYPQPITGEATDVSPTREDEAASE